MQDIMKELFYLTETTMEESPDYHEINAALEECRAQIEAQMGERFAKEAARLEFERYSLEALLCFREGFRTAVKLIKA